MKINKLLSHVLVVAALTGTFVGCGNNTKTDSGITVGTAKSRAVGTWYGTSGLQVSANKGSWLKVSTFNEKSKQFPCEFRSVYMGAGYRTGKGYVFDFEEYNSGAYGFKFKIFDQTRTDKAGGVVTYTYASNLFADPDINKLTIALNTYKK